MFSFFKSSKKHSPIESPEVSDAPVPTLPDPDDFVLIEQRSRQVTPSNPYQQSGNNVYPLIGSGSSYPQPNSSATTPIKRQDSATAFHFLQGVPFKLSNSLTGVDSTEVMRIQVDEILASLTRRLDFVNDYEFTLEQNTISVS